MFRRKNKLGNVKTNGRSSKLENAVYEILKLREKLGEISDLKEQCTVVLQGGKRITRIAWKVDFSFIKDGEQWFAEAKGFETDVYKLKLKMFRANPQGNLEIWKGSFRNPVLVETIFKNERAA